MNIDNMVDTVTTWFDDMPKNDQESFLALCEQDLITLHHTLGRSIRNEFHLWDNKWEPVIINNVDHSEEHPDSISMRIITEVWRNNHQ
jgi:hypothetical protein